MAGIVPDSISTGVSDGDGCGAGTITDIAIYSSGQKKVPFPIRYYERTQLISVGVSDSFRFYAP